MIRSQRLGGMTAYLVRGRPIHGSAETCLAGTLSVIASDHPPTVAAQAPPPPTAMKRMGFDPIADARASLGDVRRHGDQVEVPCRFAASLPVFAGHFPGRPVVPGVRLLATAIAAIGDLPPPLSMRLVIQRCKWLAPLPPDEPVVIDARERNDVWSVLCRRDGAGREPIMRAGLSWDARAADA